MAAQLFRTRRALMDAEGQEKQPAEEEAWWSQYWHKSFQLSAWELAGSEIKNVVLNASAACHRAR